MEKRKVVGLQGYFVRSMLLAVTGAGAIVLFMWLLLLHLIDCGYILPANAGEKEVTSVIQELKEGGKSSSIDNEAVYDYVEFNPDSSILNSSLSGSALEKMLDKYPDTDKTYVTGAYVMLDDGSYWLFSWRYSALFANGHLRNILPSVEIVFATVSLLVLIIYFLSYVRHISRKLSSRLDVVTAASSQIAERDLDKTIETASGLKEFDQALESMENMRQALKDSLSAQWRAEQQRREEIAALAHDIKTPLTIISGNAELLLEDDLNQEQLAITGAIVSAASRAREYIALLQQFTTEMPHETKQIVSISYLLNEVVNAIDALATQKQLSLNVSLLHGEATVNIYHSLLLRALINICENAIRYTPANSSITVEVKQDAETTSFIIKDGGKGFSPEALLHGTEMFWQEDKSRTASGNYGIGLAIAQKAATAHGGTIILENQDIGGCVTLTISA